MKRHILECSQQAALLIIALAVSLIPGTFLRGEITMPGELVYRYPPWSSHMPPDAEIPKNWLTQDAMSALDTFYLLAERAMDDGDWPLWNHQQFMGTPLLANYQTAVVYPPKLVFRALDFYTALTLFVVLKFFLCGLNAYICGRGMGLSIWASRFLSFGWMLCAYNVTWCYWPLPDSERLVSANVLERRVDRDRQIAARICIVRRKRDVVHVGRTPRDGADHGGVSRPVLLPPFGREPRPDGRKARHDRSGLGAGLWACAPCSCCPFWSICPTALRSNTGRRVTRVCTMRLPASTAILFWVPRFFGMMCDDNYWAELPINSNYSAMFYTGIAAWIAACAAWMTADRRHLICLAIPGLLSLSFVFNWPLASIVKSLPLLSATRSGYFAGFGVFAIVLIGAMGVDAWMRQPSSRQRAKWLIGITAVVVITPIAFFLGHINAIFESHVSVYVAVQIGIMAVFAIGAAVLFLGSTRFARVVPAGLALLLVVDLLIASRNIPPTSPRGTIYPETTLTAQAQELEKPARIRILPMFSPVVPPGFVAPYGIEQYHGYDAIVPARFMHFTSLMASPNWDNMARVSGVEQIWVREGDPPDVSNAELVTTVDGIAAFRQPNGLGRAFLVARARAIAGDRRSLMDAMGDPAYDPSVEILADGLPDGGLPSANNVDGGRVRIIEHRANDVIIDVDAPEACYLVLADSFFPGWTARVNGEPAEIFPAYHSFRGVVVPAGESTVEFRYRPASFRFGLIVSFVSLGVGVAVIAVMLLKRQGS
jgi:hypothetical protein